MCNDNLSGMALVARIASLLKDTSTHYSYRFLFAPGTIGAITWLARNPEAARRIAHGLVVACVGDGGRFTYKQSRRGDTELDRAVELSLRDYGQPFEVRPFVPYGYDERQYCSPGYDLSVGALSRTPYGEFPEYHTSADNLDFVQPEFLGESLEVYLSVLSVLEENWRYQNAYPYGEPQLGRRGLYSSVGGRKKSKQDELAMLWVLNQSDGRHSLIDVAERSGLSFETLSTAARALKEKQLLAEARE
jgi:aminopeptidase-like protein